MADGSHKKTLCGQLRYWHYIAVLGSLLVTILAWHTSRKHEDYKLRARFEREAAQIEQLILERMAKYEDALWAGVGLFAASDEVTRQEWKRYARSIEIEEKYPGINGIGVIEAVPVERIEEFERTQAEHYPGFKVYPAHSEELSFPIVFIEPVETNRPAVGLDMAHEEQRLAAATRARDTGVAQITGPIVLVQDEGKTPGFLFFAPFYDEQKPQTLAQRQSSFRGMVYAPFVVKKLMEGTLSKEQRHVGLRLRDGAEVLYDELVEGEADFDPEPLQRKELTLELYGRSWQFDIWSSLSFREAQTSYQSTFILIAGLFVDALLLLIFYLLARTSVRAESLAQKLTEELRKQADCLVQTNEQLEKYSYLAAHDLKSPLRAIRYRAAWAVEDAGGTLSDNSREHLAQLSASAERMGRLLDDLLTYARVDREAQPRELLNLDSLIREEVALINTPEGMELCIEPLPSLYAARTPLKQVFRNLIENAVKYHHDPKRGRVCVRAIEKDGQQTFQVSDNGPGISSKHHVRVFEMFQRLQAGDSQQGTGIGLAMVKKIVETHGGEISLESEEGLGACFSFTWPTKR